MSVSEYFEQHEEQAFVAKALATAVAITLIKALVPGLVAFLFLIMPVVFLIGIRMHAATSGVDTIDLLREHITFFPVLRSEEERRSEVKPWITYGIIFANVLIFYGFEIGSSREVIDELVFLPHHPDAFNVPISAFTSIFLHASNGHLWGNMTFLWVVGSAVERRVGRLRFGLLYLATGLLGGVAYLFVEFLFHGRAGHILGASGAIAGIMGIFAVRCYFKSMIFPVPILGIFSLIIPISLKIRLNSLLIMALFFISDLSGGVQQIAGESSSMVGHWAHLGGMISGMLIAGYLKLGEDAVEERHLEIGIKASQASMGFQGGERSLQIALKRNPNNAEAVLGMARLKTKFHPTPEGEVFYRKALLCLLNQGSAEVPGVFREYLGKYHEVPREPRLVSRLAEVLRTAGETELLIPCLERLVEEPAVASPAREKALYQLATLLEFTSCFEAARGCFARFAYEYPASILTDAAREKAAGAVYQPPRQSRAEQEVAPRLCPSCGKGMTVRTSTSGPQLGIPFWVCAGFPDCRTFHPVAAPAEAGEPAAAIAQAPPQSYRLILDGTIGFTYEPQEVKENLVRLFRCSPDQADRLCSGNPTVLKRGLDRAAAVKYKQAISQTGALCTIESEEPPGAPVAAVEAAAAQTRQEPVAQPAPPVQPQLSIACPKCGHFQEKGESCVACGVYFAKVAKLAERDFHSFRDHLARGDEKPAMPESDERHWAMLCHLLALTGIVIPFANIVAPLLVWLWKRNQSAFVDYHGRTAVNYQITFMILCLGLAVVGALTRFNVVFLWPAFGILGLYTLVMVLVAAMKSRRGDYVEFAFSAEIVR